MLDKLLFKNQDRKQLIIAMIGAFLGITFMCTAIHYLIKVNQFGEGSEILGPNTIIVQKKVTSANNGLRRTDFRPSEIEALKEESFILDVQPVVSNNFSIYFETNSDLVPKFGSDIFVQTIDTSFIDVNAEEWQWKEGDKSLPIIMPRDILVMLNTFMSAQGITQVSDKVAQQIKIKFTLKDSEKKEWIDAHIIGFTSEMSAILVPKSFMEYGNAKYSDGKDNKITQIVISGKENEFGLVEELMERKGLQSKDASLAIGRLKSIIGTLFLVVLAISIIAVFVSGLVLTQYLQLLMSRNAYQVRTLMRIGHHPKDIIRRFFVYFLKVFGIVLACGTLSFVLLKFFLDGMFEDGGIYIDTAFTLWSAFALLLAYFIFAVSSYRTASRGIFKEY